MRTVAVIQARAGSTRLPGKVLEDLAGHPVLEWVVRAARAARGLDDVIVATSTLPGDDAVADLAASLGAPRSAVWGPACPGVRRRAARRRASHHLSFRCGGENSHTYCIITIRL